MKITSNRVLGLLCTGVAVAALYFLAYAPAQISAHELADGRIGQLRGSETALEPIVSSTGCTQVIHSDGNAVQSSLYSASTGRAICNNKEVPVMIVAQHATTDQTSPALYVESTGKAEIVDVKSHAVTANKHIEYLVYVLKTNTKSAKCGNNTYAFRLVTVTPKHVNIDADTVPSCTPILALNGNRQGGVTIMSPAYAGNSDSLETLFDLHKHEYKK